MRQISIGATGSNRCVRLGGNSARVLTVAFPIGLMLGYAQIAAAASDLQSEPQFIATQDVSLQPGPGLPPSVGAARSTGNARGTLAEPVPAVPAAGPAPYSEAYWGAFADADLNTLRTAARTDPEARFAGAMALLAGGYFGDAERALLDVSQQVAEINVAVASRIMLASTLRYEHKWSQLRDLPLTAPDNTITSELEQWGKAFASTPQEVIHFPGHEVTLPLRLTTIGTPTVRVRINGKDYDFWIDTGSTMTVISSEVVEATKSAVLSSDTLSVKTFSGSAPVRATTIKSLEIGSIVISNTPAVIIDASLMYLRTSAAGDPPSGIAVDGIIGWDTIRHFDLTMDYRDGKITLKEPIFRGDAVGSERNLVWLARPLIEVRTKDGGKFHFALDTGAQASFLNATVLAKTGTLTRSSAARVHGLAHTGKETTRVVPILALTLAGRTIPLENVIVYGPVESGLINCDGILGSDVAQFGAIHIDATNGVFSVALSDDAEDSAE
ncbi:MAG TPA: aspartyl protease family protein [Gemmatimonadaceae bacterium]